MDRAKDILLISVVTGVIFFFNLGGPKLWDRDEPRNAGCAKEMLARGNFITPIFNDELRDAKPVLLYWFIISAYQFFGENEFAARFWSATLALGTVLCTYSIARRFFSRRVGILAAIVLSTSLMFDVAARAATPDSMLIFFSTAALAVFAAYAFPKSSAISNESSATEPLSTETVSKESAASQDHLATDPAHRGFPRSWLMALALYALMALGVLAKGPIAFLMPTAIIGMFLLIVTLPPRQNRNEEADGSRNSWGQRVIGAIASCLRPFHPVHFAKTCISMRLLLAAMVILLVAGPWYVMVGLETDGAFLKTFFLKEHLGRSTTSFENHSGGVFYYPLVMCLGFFPWSVFALPVFVTLWKSRQELSPQVIFLLCWVGVQVTVFTIVQTKLPSYVTPCYPALAMIVAYYLHSWATSEIQIPIWLPRFSFATLGIAGVAILIGLGYAASQLLEIGMSIAWVGLLPILSSLIVLTLWNRQMHPESQQKAAGIPSARMNSALVALSVSAVLFSVSFFGFVLTKVSRSQNYDQLLQGTSQNDQPLGSFGCLEPTWVFYSGRPVYELVSKSKNTGTPLTRADNEWRPKPRPSLSQFLIEEQGQVITLAKLVPDIESRIGTRVRILQQTGYFLKKDQLVLIEATPPTTAHQATSSNWK